MVTTSIARLVAKVMTKTFHYNCSNLSVYLEKIKKDWWLKLLQFLGQNLSKEGGTNGVGIYALALLAALEIFKMTIVAVVLVPAPGSSQSTSRE